MEYPDVLFLLDHAGTFFSSDKEEQDKDYEDENEDEPSTSATATAAAESHFYSPFLISHNILFRNRNFATYAPATKERRAQLKGGFFAIQKPPTTAERNHRTVPINHRFTYDVRKKEYLYDFLLLSSILCVFMVRL